MRAVDSVSGPIRKVLDSCRFWRYRRGRPELELRFRADYIVVRIAGVEQRVMVAIVYARELVSREAAGQNRSFYYRKTFSETEWGSLGSIEGYR